MLVRHRRYLVLSQRFKEIVLIRIENHLTYKSILEFVIFDLLETSFSPTVSSPTVSSPTVSSPTVSSPTVSSPTVLSSSSKLLVHPQNSRHIKRHHHDDQLSFKTPLKQLVSHWDRAWDPEIFTSIPSQLQKKSLPSYPHASLTPSVNVAALNLPLNRQHKAAVVAKAISLELLTKETMSNQMRSTGDRAQTEDPLQLYPSNIPSEDEEALSRRSNAIPFTKFVQKSPSLVSYIQSRSDPPQLRVPVALRRLPKKQQSLLLAQQREQARHQAEIVEAGERERELLSSESIEELIPGDISLANISSVSMKRNTSSEKKEKGFASIYDSHSRSSKNVDGSNTQVLSSRDVDKGLGFDRKMSSGRDINASFSSTFEHQSTFIEPQPRVERIGSVTLKTSQVNIEEDAHREPYKEHVHGRNRAFVQAKRKIRDSATGPTGERKKLRVVIALSSWMGHPKIREMILWDVCIPGTHNSASWKLSEDHQRKWSGVVFAFLKLYIHCQEVTIFQQLQLGIRFVDLRVCKNLARKGEPYCAHGGFRTIPFKDVLNQVNAFLEAHPTEVIVLSVRRDVAYLTGPGSLGILESDFWVAACLKKWLGSQLEANVTIGQLVDRCQNVLYFFEERERFLPPIMEENGESYLCYPHPSSVVAMPFESSALETPSTETSAKQSTGTNAYQEKPVSHEAASALEDDMKAQQKRDAIVHDQCQPIASTSTTISRLSEEVSVSSTRVGTISVTNETVESKAVCDSLRGSRSSGDKKLAAPRRSVLGTLLSPKLAVASASQNVLQKLKIQKGLFFTPLSGRNSSVGSEASESPSPLGANSDVEESGGYRSININETQQKLGAGRHIMDPQEWHGDLHSSIKFSQKVETQHLLMPHTVTSAQPKVNIKDGYVVPDKSHREVTFALGPSHYVAESKPSTTLATAMLELQEQQQKPINSIRSSSFNSQPDLSLLFRPRRQLTRWVKHNVPKYWVTRLESMPDALFQELRNTNTFQSLNSEASVNPKWKEWFDTPTTQQKSLAYNKTSSTGSSSRSRRNSAVSGRAFERSGSAIGRDILRTALPVRSRSSYSLDRVEQPTESADIQQNPVTQHELQSEVPRGYKKYLRYPPFMYNKVRRRQSVPFISKRKSKLLSTVVTAAVKRDEVSPSSSIKSPKFIPRYLSRRADSLTFPPGDDRHFRITQRALEVRHKEAVDAARELIEAEKRTAEHVTNLKSGIDDEVTEAIDIPNHAEVKEGRKTKVKKKRSGIKVTRRPQGENRTIGGQRSSIEIADVENFLQTMKSVQSSIRAAEVLEKAKQAVDDADDGYASDRSGITALPAAKAMGDLLSTRSVSVSEALEKAGVDVMDLGLDAEDENLTTVTDKGFARTPSRLQPGYSDPDLGRLLARAELEESPQATVAGQTFCGTKSPPMDFTGHVSFKPLEKDMRTSYVIKRRTKSFDNFERRIMADEEDPLLHRRQTTLFGAFVTQSDMNTARSHVEGAEEKISYPQAGNLVQLMSEMQEGGRLDQLGEILEQQPKLTELMKEKEDHVLKQEKITKAERRSSRAESRRQSQAASGRQGITSLASSKSTRLATSQQQLENLTTVADQLPSLLFPTESLPESLRHDIARTEEHHKRRAARMARTAQRHRPNESPHHIKKLTRDEIVQSLLGRAASGVMDPLTPFVSGRTRIQKSWHMTCDPDPQMLCKKLVYWTTLQGCTRPRKPFIIKMLAGEVTPPSFDSPETSMEVVRFWTVQGATALVLRNGGLKSAAVETHNILNRAVTNRVNGVTHDFVNQMVVSRMVKLNILAAVGPEELKKWKKSKAKETRGDDRE